MPLFRKTPSSLMQFLYAAGAMILLIASLLLALEMRYAKEIFGLGLFIEIIVFSVSIIDPGKESPADTYSTEIVFPPSKEGRGPSAPKAKTESKKALQSDLSKSIDTMNDSVLKLMGTTEQLARSVDHLESDYRELLNNTSSYHQDIQRLRDQLEATNAKINALN